MVPWDTLGVRDGPNSQGPNPNISSHTFLGCPNGPVTPPGCHFGWGFCFYKTSLQPPVRWKVIFQGNFAANICNDRCSEEAAEFRKISYLELLCVVSQKIVFLEWLISQKNSLKNSSSRLPHWSLLLRCFGSKGSWCKARCMYLCLLSNTTLRKTINSSQKTKISFLSNIHNCR